MRTTTKVKVAKKAHARNRRYPRWFDPDLYTYTLYRQGNFTTCVVESRVVPNVTESRIVSVFWSTPRVLCRI